MGTGERPERLSQRTAGQQLSVPPGVAGAGHDDLKILVEGSMLKAIVQNYSRDPEAVLRDPDGLCAIRTDHDGNAGQAASEEKGLVSRILGLEADRGGIGHNLHTATAPPVASAHHRWAVA
jgi:hypothetical protein